MTTHDFTQVNQLLLGMSAEDVLLWTLKRFSPQRVLLATSFGAEDQVLTDMLSKIDPSVHLFTLDTGRLFPETYEVMQATLEKYRMKIHVCSADPLELSNLVREKGPNLFYQSRENRLACCAVRKLHPLKKVLVGFEAWICGLRREQAVTRTQVQAAEWDEIHGLAKVNPLRDWSELQVWDYIRKNSVPYNSLHDKGFRSIGCAPCTRATLPGEDVRAGRWWWEGPEKKECGLHNRKV